MTKQAMNHLLARLEQLGYITRAAAPDDGRGTVLHLTARGRDVERIMMESSAELERKWARVFGRAEMKELKALLAELDAEVSAT